MKGIINLSLVRFISSSSVGPVLRNTLLGSTLLFSMNNYADNPRDGGELTLGGGFMSFESPFDSRTSGFRVDIDGRYQWRGLFAETGSLVNRQKNKPAIGFNFYNTDHWNFDFLGTIADDNVDYLYRVGRINVSSSGNSIAAAGFRAIGSFNDTTIQLMGLPIASEGSRDDGILRYASLWINQQWQHNKWTLKASIGAQYRTGELLERKYDIQQWQANNYFPAYDVGDGTDYTAHFELNYAITDHVFMQPYFSITEFSDSVIESPLIETAIDTFDRPEQERKVGINFNYRF